MVSRLSVIYFILCCTACAGLKIPSSIPQFPEKDIFGAIKDGVTVEIRPFAGLNEYYELFDDNLPSAGMVCLWARVHNTGAESLDLSKARWAIRSSAVNGRSLDARSVLERFYKGRRIRFYSVAADRKSQLELEPMIFPRTILASGQIRHGLLFFKMLPASTRGWTGPARIFLSNALRGNQGIPDFEIPIRNVHP